MLIEALGLQASWLAGRMMDSLSAQVSSLRNTSCHLNRSTTHQQLTSLYTNTRRKPREKNTLRSRMSCLDMVSAFGRQRERRHIFQLTHSVQPCDSH